MPLCYLPEKRQIFYLRTKRDFKTKEYTLSTWLYDIAANRWTDLRPKHHPPQTPVATEFLPKQDAVYAMISRYTGAQWVYSFEKNDWARLTATCIKNPGAYAQVRYIPQHDVLVACGNTGRRTAVMRPDVSKAEWKE